MTQRSKALIALITTVLLWGLSFISIKISMAVFGPMTLGALRFSMALILLFFIKKKLAPEEKADRKDLPLLIGAGLAGVTLYFYFENNGVALIPASEASIIVGSVPVLVMIIGILEEKIINARKRKAGIYVEKMSLLNKIVLPGTGAIISLAGVALVAGVSFALRGTIKGYLFMFGACISWIFYLYIIRSLFKRHSQIFVIFWQSIVGSLGFLPFAILESVKVPWQMPGLYVWGNVIFLGICCSAAAYWCYAYAMQGLGVRVASLFINFIPVVSAIGGFFILGERLEPLQWLGAVLVLAGVYIVMFTQKASA